MSLILPGYVRKKWIVCSHERSGTHFLMNSLAKNFTPYCSDPWLDFEPCEPWVPENIAHGLGNVLGRKSDEIVKSHHEVRFYEKVLDLDIVQDHYQFFYIFRNPEDVMKSCHKHFNSMFWHGGPKTDTYYEFAEAEPTGACLRYQWTQHKTMYDRWESHVKGWCEDLDPSLRSTIIYVRFEDLRDDFDRVINEISKLTRNRLLDVPRKPAKEDSKWINDNHMERIAQKQVLQ